MRHSLQLAFIAVFAATPAAASAATRSGYSAGTGANASQLVIDFGFTGGDAYVFEYRYDGEKTGLDLLLDLDAAGGLEVFTDVFSFGTSVRGFAFDGNTADTGFNAETGQFWSYFVDGGFQDLDFNGTFDLGEAAAAGAYLSAGVGAGSRLITDGSVDGYIENISPFNNTGDPATDLIPASVPEPATLAVLTVGLVAARRRRA